MVFRLCRIISQWLEYEVVTPNITEEIEARTELQHFGKRVLGGEYLEKISKISVIAVLQEKNIEYQYHKPENYVPTTKLKYVYN